jgi:hypothetical protein
VHLRRLEGTDVGEVCVISTKFWEGAQEGAHDLMKGANDACRVGKAKTVRQKVYNEGMIVFEFGCFIDNVCCTIVFLSSCISCIFMCGTRCTPNTLFVIVHFFVVQILKSVVGLSWVSCTTYLCCYLVHCVANLN